MDKYTVKLMPRAYRDLDEIYVHVAVYIGVKDTAESLLDELEKVILSLEQMPYRGAKRSTGIYANKGYRQVFLKNFVVIYRIVEETKEVLIVTVRYTPSNF